MTPEKKPYTNAAEEEDYFPITQEFEGLGNRMDRIAERLDHHYQILTDILGEVNTENNMDWYHAYEPDKEFGE